MAPPSSNGVDGTEERRGTWVVTLRIRERGILRKVGHTTMASAHYPSSGVPLANNKLISPNGYSKPYPMVVCTPKVSRSPPRGGLDSEFPCPRTLAHDRQGLVLSDRYARQLIWSVAAYWLFAANLYMCIHMHIHVHIQAYTYPYMCTHIYTSICPPAIRRLPTRHTVGVSFLLQPYNN